MENQNFRLLNFTPHQIVLYKGSEKIHTIPSSGNIRLEEAPQKSNDEIYGVPVYIAPEYTGLEGVPEELYKKDGEEIGIVVSMPVGLYLKMDLWNDTLPGRVRVFGPDTSPKSVVRGEGGVILGSTALIQYK